MAEKLDSISQRKREHLELCLTDDVAFINKTTGFENYDFIHDAITEVDLNKINFETEFFNKKIGFPFLISCMTGGVSEAENINAQLAVAANQLNIPIGVGSQRQALENESYIQSYKILRKNAPTIPVLGNIGAAQLVKFKEYEKILYLKDLIEADAMVIHANPLQELLQDNGNPDFRGFLKSVEKLVKYLDIPVIIKEVGSGISKKSAERLLNIGVKGIDVAGAGGTSWAAVEILRNGGNSENEFWDWGLPTSYCLRTIIKLKNKFDFMLIGSGGINNAFNAAKAYALGADITASARIILHVLKRSGVDGVVKLIEDWFEKIKKIMFLTGSNSISDLQNKKILRKEKLY